MTLLRIVWDRQTRGRSDREVAESILIDIREGRIQPAGIFRNERDR